MRRNIIFIAVAAFMLTACASSSNVINDDAYYSPYDKNSSYDNTLVTSNYGNFDASTVKAEKRNNDVETTTIYQDYSSEDV
ncbi:MAG: membrane lipoprotein lipid attachment site-containing protein, partial [Bacteroidales bacterium]|nr:membrane lipoprotein lipid attachment site-containing protein [Bacteroidales bacterium]